MRNGKQKESSGRPRNWDKRTYPLDQMRLPKALKKTLLRARSKKISVSKLVKAIQQAA